MANSIVVRTMDQFEYPVWDQQKKAGEKDSYYMQFLSYCNLKPSERTITAAWRVWVDGTARVGRKVSTTFRSTADKFLWDQRAAARDINEIKARYTVWSERDWDWRESDYEFGDKLRAIAQKALDKLDLNSDDINLSLGDIVDLYKIASTLQKGSIPSIGQINSAQIGDILRSLPSEKKSGVLRIVMAEMSTGRNAEELVAFDESFVGDNVVEYYDGSKVDSVQNALMKIHEATHKK